jgi:hypothetical protein
LQAEISENEKFSEYAYTALVIALADALAKLMRRESVNCSEHD